MGRTSPYSHVTDKNIELLGSGVPQDRAVGAGEAGVNPKPRTRRFCHQRLPPRCPPQPPWPLGARHSWGAVEAGPLLCTWERGVPCHGGSGRIRGTCFTVDTPGLPPHRGTGAWSTVGGVHTAAPWTLCIVFPDQTHWDPGGGGGSCRSSSPHLPCVRFTGHTWASGAQGGVLLETPVPRVPRPTESEHPGTGPSKCSSTSLQ